VLTLLSPPESSSEDDGDERGKSKVEIELNAAITHPRRLLSLHKRPQIFIEIEIKGSGSDVQLIRISFLHGAVSTSALVRKLSVITRLNSC
jgi:hypothetical protein